MLLAVLHSLVGVSGSAGLFSFFTGFSVDKATTLLDIPHLAKYISALSTVGIACLAYSALRSSIGGRSGVILGTVAGCWLIVYPPLVEVTGHETLTQIFLVMGAIAIWPKSTTLSAVVFGAATLVRPDAVVAVALLGTFLLYQELKSGVKPWHWKRSRTARAALAFVATVAPWVIFATWFYGSPIPGTLLAKQSQTLYGFWPITTIPALWNGALSGLPDYSQICVGVLVLAGGAFALGRLCTLQRLVLWWLTYAVVYHLLNVTLWVWYYSPIAVAVPILSVYGVYRISLLAYAQARNALGRIQDSRADATGLAQKIAMTLSLITLDWRAFRACRRSLQARSTICISIALPP